ncbi:four helix bundle protein [Candidatus Peregrinibacteria bacterium]|nr:four helix bundle protein [Candidatus Peregrinibacteria bacterium]
MNKIELEERTLKFSKNLISIIKLLPRNQINYKLSGQAIGSGTSIGANYREANAAESKKDFKHKINIVLKEAKETKYWLELIMHANYNLDINNLADLFKESDELMRIFGKVVATCTANIENDKY